MGATADTDRLSLFPDQQILLMPELLRHQMPLPHHLQAVGLHRETGLPIPIGPQTQPFPGLHAVLRPHQPGMSLQRPVQPDVLVLPVVMRPESMGAHIHRRRPIDLQKPAKPTSVIVMPVGQHRQIYLPQIHAQLRRVVSEGIGLPHIEEDLMAPGLKIQAQPMLRRQPIPAGGVLHQDHDPHDRSSFPSNCRNSASSAA